MEKQISELTEIDENEIAKMIYEKVDLYWGKFPNIWNYVTKDDMATQVAMDLYRPRKADGVSHIIHYYNTRGERSLKPLIGMITWNVLVAEARDIHSTGVFSNDARRNIYRAISMETPMGDLDGEGLTLGDTIEGNCNVESDVNFSILYENIPDKIIDNVYYIENGEYKNLSYKRILQGILSGYNLTQMSENLFKLNKKGMYCNYRELGYLVKEMKEDIKRYLSDEYGYTEEKYKEGWSIL